MQNSKTCRYALLVGAGLLGAWGPPAFAFDLNGSPSGRATLLTQPGKPLALRLPPTDVLALLGPLSARGEWPRSYRVGELRRSLDALGRGAIADAGSLPVFTPEQVGLVRRLLETFVHEYQLTDTSLVRLQYDDTGGRVSAVWIARVQLRDGAPLMRVSLSDAGKAIMVYAFHEPNRFTLEKAYAMGSVFDLKQALHLPLTSFPGLAPLTPAVAVLVVQRDASGRDIGFRVESLETDSWELPSFSIRW
jgi:hypothetical protein